MKPGSWTWVGAVAAVVSLQVGLSAAPAFAAQTVRCESYNNRRSVCPLPGPGAVRVSRVLSQSACVQGRSWNYDRHYIWVDDGCRAEFAVGSSSSSSGAGEAIAAAAIVGLAIAAAAASGDDDPPPPPPQRYSEYGQGYGPGYGPPPGYGQGYGPPPSRGSRVPGWMVGKFAGFNPQQRLRIDLDIYPDGRVFSKVNGNPVDGYVQGQRLFIAGNLFDVTPTVNGIITRQVGNPGNETHYGRAR